MSTMNTTPSPAEEPHTPPGPPSITPTPPNPEPGVTSGIQPIADNDPRDTERAYLRGYLQGLNEKAAKIMQQPDEGEEPYPEGQNGSPITPDPFFLPAPYSVWD